MKNYFIITLLLFSVYFTQAQIVNIPDANFKNALISTNCVDVDGDGIGDVVADINGDFEIQVSEAEDVINLIVDSNNISSLEGIQSFTNLEVLDCWNNPLIDIDVTQNLNLIFLDCYNTHISSLDVSQNLNLEILFCQSFQLTSLDVSQNLNLSFLSCPSSQLSSLDVSQNPNLEKLTCWNNQLTSLDVSQNPNLKNLFLEGNQITSLDVSQNPNLEKLECWNNQLTSLNINNGNNLNITRMFAYDNSNLTCIQVDDETAIYPKCEINFLVGWCKDDWAEYSEDCALGVSDFELYNIKIYPNPVQNTLNINSEFPIDFIKIYTLQGQLVNESKNNQIDVSLLTSGLYFVSVIIDGQNIVKKFIKN